MKILRVILCFVFSAPLWCHAMETITDEKIVYISKVTNQIQLKGSRFVNPLADFYEVKNFSNTMLVDYQNYQNVMLDFIYRYQLFPEPSEKSAEIEARGKEALENLSHLKGRALEKQYIEYEIELHEQTLDSIDNIFLPNVKIVELRNMINSIRPNVVNRLEWAMRIKAMYKQLEE